MSASASRRGLPGPRAGGRQLRGARRGWAAGGLIAFGVLLLAALGGYAWQAGREPQLRGVIVGVEARDIGHAASILVRGQDGNETRLLVDPSVDSKWTPGHLRDHMMFAQPVTVHYRRAGDALVAYRIVD